MIKKKSNTQTNFGYRKVETDMKSKMINEVFDRVAENYDLMNDLMSFGLHRFWKRFAVNSLPIRADSKILDLAGGTGDITRLVAEKVNGSGVVVLSDFNMKMLKIGRDKLIDQGILNFHIIQLNAEELPFKKNYFDIIYIAFGLRNLTNKQKSLISILNCLKPGGALVVLEFSKPTNETIREIYDLYSFEVIPKLGKLINKDEESYRYLAESIRMHPNQGELQTLMEKLGFINCSYENITNGIVAIHTGIKAK